MRRGESGPRVRLAGEAEEPIPALGGDRADKTRVVAVELVGVDRCLGSRRPCLRRSGFGFSRWSKPWTRPSVHRKPASSQS
jgi:hypothetical protein